MSKLSPGIVAAAIASFLVAAPGPTPAVAQETQMGGPDAGTIEMTVGGETTTFNVLEGGDRVVTGYSTAIRGEAERMFISLTGRPAGSSGEQIFIKLVVDPASGTQYCDPMANQVAYKPSAEENQRNEPPVQTQGDCPDSGIYIEGFEYDESAERVSVSGGFAATLRNVDGKPEATGTFDVTVGPYRR